MKDQIKEIWKKHKGRIIVGGVIISGGILFIITKKTNGASTIAKFKSLAGVMPEFNFPFNDLGEALAKAEELNKTSAPGNIAIWLDGMEGYKYLVQDLN